MLNSLWFTVLLSVFFFIIFLIYKNIVDLKVDFNFKKTAFDFFYINVYVFLFFVTLVNFYVQLNYFHYYTVTFDYINMLNLIAIFIIFLAKKNNTSVIDSMAYVSIYLCFNFIAQLDDFITIFIFFEIINFVILTIVFNNYIKNTFYINSSAIFYIVLFNFFSTSILLMFLIYSLKVAGTTNLLFLTNVLCYKKTKTFTLLTILYFFKLGFSPLYFVNTYLYKFLSHKHLTFYFLINFYYTFFFLSVIDFKNINNILIYLFVYFSFFFIKNYMGYKFNKYDLLVLSSQIFLVQYFFFFVL